MRIPNVKNIVLTLAIIIYICCYIFINRDKLNLLNKTIPKEINNVTTSTAVDVEINITRLKKEKKHMKNNFYIKSAFRVSYHTIRLSLIKYAYNNDTLIWRIGTKYAGVVLFECTRERCPSRTSPPCTFVGFIGIIYLPEKIESIKELVLQSKMTNEHITIPIIDVRKTKNVTKYKHKLGVCIQPVFLFSDYIELIVFLEHWIAQGATKFYFYKTSFTKNIQNVLSHYRKYVKNIEIETVEWSMLPGNNKNDSDPNLFIFRLEPFLAIMDCMYRARYVVKYVAQIDLDEMIVVSKKYSNLLEFLEKKLKEDNSISSLSFKSQFIKYKKNWQSLDDLKKYKFNFLANVKLSKKLFRPIYTKLVYLPETNFNFYIHYALKTETGILTSKLYNSYNVKEYEGTVLHHRKMKAKWYFQPCIYDNKSIFEREIPILNKNLGRHIKHLSLEENGFDQNLESSLKKFSVCRENLKEKRTMICTSLRLCEHHISENIWQTFISVNQSWYVV
uniref:Glycosyltransferase family 92 protein n=1 Tax=Strongyloides venezuelensis TaxID=75913 RepID=A0A0K0F3Q8_STRVS